MGDVRAEVREFLSTRRARISPDQAGLPAYGGNRRVAGLRREEVAMLTGVSVEYYVRLQRGNLAGASESVLDALARTLQLDDAERQYLFDLARNAGPAPRRRTKPSAEVRPAVRQVLDAMADAPAWVRNGRHDVHGTLGSSRAMRGSLAEESPATVIVHLRFLARPRFFGLLTSSFSSGRFSIGPRGHGGLQVARHGDQRRPRRELVTSTDDPLVELLDLAAHGRIVREPIELLVQRGVILAEG